LIVGVDRNMGYARRYRSGARNRDVAVVIADVKALPFRPAVFAQAFCTELLEHVAGYADVFPEMSRIGMTGGSYVIAFPVARWERLFRKLHPRWLQLSGHVNILEHGQVTRELESCGVRVTGVAGANSWPCLYWCCHSLARSDFNDAGLATNNHWIDAMSIRAERLLRRLRLWTVFNSAGDKFWPKSWVIHAIKD
jgi:hypothetical protein